MGKVYLRAFEYQDMKFINELRNDGDIFKFTCGNKYFISTERDKQWIEDKIFNNYNQLYLMISEVDGDNQIGYICATDIDYVNRKAQWGGIVIHEKFSGKGYGTQSAELLLSHLFFECNINTVYGYWRTDHTVSLKIAEKLGFKKDGVMRNFVYKQGEFHDAYLLSILKEEFRVKS